MTGGSLDLGFLDEGAEVRRHAAQKRSRAALAISAGITVLWLVFVTAMGHWGRVADHWGAALTMVFGSFVAGSTPQGGGAVAFPVFTKVLDVPAEVARSFSLSIQAIGMGAATAAILVTRRRVEWRAVFIGVPVATVAFIVTLFTLGDRSEPFWPSILPGPYVKITFTVVLAAMAWVVLLGQRTPVKRVDHELPTLNRRLTIALVLAGALGGLAAALVGSGADVMIYLFVVVLFGIDPRVGIPTSVVSMAAISVVGFIVLGIFDGQLSIGLDNAGTMVTAVGDTNVSLEAARFDLFGMWLAAAPVVAWGAPLGSWAASQLTARQLATFVLSLAALEVLSTAIFVDELRTSTGLLLYALGGLALAIGGLTLVARRRRTIFALPGIDASATLPRDRIEFAADFDDALDR